MMPFFTFVLLLSLAFPILAQQSPGPRSLTEVLCFTEPAVASDAFIALFPASVFSLQTPFQVYHATIFSFALREPFAACHGKALSFFGTKDAIKPTFCKEPSFSKVFSYVVNRAMSEIFPIQSLEYSRFLASAGLRPFDFSTDMSTEIGWGNVIGMRIANYFKNDGWNTLGDRSRRFFKNRFEDTTGFSPVNPPEMSSAQIPFPLRWHPLTQSYDNNGDFASQVHVVPHIGQTVQPLSMSADAFNARQSRKLYNSPNQKGKLNGKDKKKVGNLLKGLLKRSQAMNERKFLLSKWWDSKFLSLGAFSVYYMGALNMTSHDSVQLFAAEMMAQHDAIVLAWREKRRHDLVRPSTLVNRVMGKKSIKAWRGLDLGVGALRADEWEPAIRTMPHSEYPSASALICSASLEQLEMALRQKFGANFDIPDFQWEVDPLVLGLLRPEGKIKVTYRSLKDAAHACGQSRLDAGVHFAPAVAESNRLAKGLGKAAYKTMAALEEGRIPKHCHWCYKS